MVYQCFSSVSLAITSPILGQIAEISESDPLIVAALIQPSSHVGRPFFWREPPNKYRASYTKPPKQSKPSMNYHELSKNDLTSLKIQKRPHFLSSHSDWSWEILQCSCCILPQHMPLQWLGPGRHDAWDPWACRMRWSAPLAKKGLDGLDLESL